MDKNLKLKIIRKVKNRLLNSDDNIIENFAVAKGFNQFTGAAERIFNSWVKKGEAAFRSIIKAAEERAQAMYQEIEDGTQMVFNDVESSVNTTTQTFKENTDSLINSANEYSTKAVNFVEKNTIDNVNKVVDVYNQAVQETYDTAEHAVDIATENAKAAQNAFEGEAGRIADLFSEMEGWWKNIWNDFNDPGGDDDKSGKQLLIYPDQIKDIPDTTEFDDNIYKTYNLVDENGKPLEYDSKTQAENLSKNMDLVYQDGTPIKLNSESNMDSYINTSTESVNKNKEDSIF